MRSRIFYISLPVVGAVLLWGILCVPYNEAQQAKFNVDAIGRFISSSRVVRNKSIGSLSELPDFHIVSAQKSFSVRSRDIRDGQSGSYRYALKNSDNGRFVISASPAGFFSPKEEFAVTEDGILRYNTQNVDPEPDSYDEVVNWQEIQNDYTIRTDEYPP